MAPLLVHVWHIANFGLSLSFLKDHLGLVRGLYHAHPVLGLLACCLLEIALFTLAVPGAAILDLTAGAVFGLWPGFFIMLLGSVLGSLSAFVAGRYFLQEWAEKRLGEKAHRIRDGFERHGNLYLLSLRLIPLLPHFVLNFGVSLTRMSLWDFIWVTAIGNIPAVWALVNAGTAIAEIHSFDDAMTPRTIVALCALGALPIAALAGSMVLRRLSPTQRRGSA